MTLTSNIHLGIAGWSNATYVVGARRSNAGNAYQVTSPGTSTSPPTGTGTGINNGGTAIWKYLSAVDYTTWQAHAAAIPSSPGQPVLGLLWFSGGVITPSVGSYLLQLTGHTTSNVNTITYRPAPGESFKDFYVANPTAAYAYSTTTGVCFQLPSSGAGNINYIEIDDQWVILDGIQIKDPNASSASSIIGGTGANLTIQNCIIDGYAQSGGARILNPSGANLTFDNNLVVGRNTLAGSAILSTSGGSGAIVVNNTFVHTTLVSGQVVLDAGSNTTSASCTSTNNVFMNYGQVYAASSGTPWASDHCAYSAASFGTQNGTDGGGSVYGITGASAFVSFSTNMNPKSGGPLINAGTTGANVPTTDAFGNTRPQGSAPDIGAVELLAIAATVICDLRSTLDFKETVPYLGGAFTAVGPVFPIAWTRTHAISSSSPVEWRSSLFRDARIVIEEPAAAPQLFSPFTGDFTSDFGLASSYTEYPVFLVEWGTQGGPAVVSDSLMPIAWTTSLRRDLRLTVEQLSTSPHLASPFTNEFTNELGEGPFALDPVFITEWQAKNFSVSIVMPAEWRASIDVRTPLAVASGATRASDIIAGVEWRTSTAGISSTLVAAIEWRTAVSTDAASAVSWSATVGSGTALSPLEWRSTILSSLGASIEWRASTVTDMMAAVSPLEVFQASAVFPIAATMVSRSDMAANIFTLASQDIRVVAALEWGTLQTISASFSMEWGIGLSSIAALTPPIEWRAGLRTDVTAPIAALTTRILDISLSLAAGSVTATSAVMAVEAGKGISATASIPIEFGHLLINLQVDVAFALEMAATVSSDLVAAMELRHIRHDFGSKLEPDRWEKDHEP